MPDKLEQALDLLRRIRALCTPLGTDSGDVGIIRMIDNSGLLANPQREIKTLQVTLNDIRRWNIGGGLPLGLILVRGSKKGLQMFDRYILEDIEVDWDLLWGPEGEPFNPYQEFHTGHVVVTCDNDMARMAPEVLVRKAVLILTIDDGDGNLIISVHKQRVGDAPTLMTVPLAELGN